MEIYEVFMYDESNKNGIMRCPNGIGSSTEECEREKGGRKKS